MAKSYFRKLANKGKKVAKKRYLTKKGLPKMGRIMKDVQRLKKMVNAEKKRYDFSTQDGDGYVLGQVQGNTENARVINISPSMPVGAQNGQRIGNSVKMHSAFIRLQFVGQVALVSQQRHRFDVWYTDNQEDLSPGTILPKLFQANEFNGLFDYNSTRNQAYFTQYTRVCTRSITIASEDIANEVMIKDFAIPLKLTKHLKWNDAITGRPTTGCYFITVRSDSGNGSATTPCTLTRTLPNKAVNTGSFMNISVAEYYYDN